MAKWLRKWRRGWLYVHSNTKNATSLFPQSQSFILCTSLEGRWFGMRGSKNLTPTLNIRVVFVSYVYDPVYAYNQFSTLHIQSMFCRSKFSIQVLVNLIFINVMWSSIMSRNSQILFLRYTQTKAIVSFVSYCLFNPSTVCIFETNYPISVRFSPN